MKERNLNADLIRCVAVFSVISVHFLKNNGFYSMPVVGLDMLLMCMYRSLFMVCVPLFLILTGFLMWKKQLSGQYYRGILKTLEIYVLASIAHLIFKAAVLGEEVTLWSAIRGILSFQAANYAWYIEMYIGLFLMIPFLNLAYHGLKNRRQKQVLVGTMLLITMVPKLINNFNLVELSWWMAPGTSTDYDKLVPSFFTGMYPITYYFLGMYLREYSKDMKYQWWKKLLLFLLCVVLFGCYNYYRSDGGKFVWGSNNTWGGENLITAALLFSLLLDVRMERWPKVIKNAIVYLSGIALGVYLISWIFDKIVYDMWFLPRVAQVQERFLYYPIIVPAVFLGSIGGAAVIYGVRKLLLLSAGRISWKKR